MLPFKTLITINKNAATPVYQQIANSLAGLIRDGVIKPGSSLPSSRGMASLLQVHRKTVVAAYEELYTQDWIVTVPRKGIMVSQLLPELKPRTFKAAAKTSAYAGNTGFHFQKVVSSPPRIARQGKYRIIINDGFPDPRIAPIDMLLREYNRLFRMKVKDSAVLLGYQFESINIRKVLAQFISDTRGMNITADNILMTRGANMAIYIAARMILKPGSTVIVSEPNYFMANMIFTQCGAKLVKVAADENGIDVDAIAKLCKKKKPDLLYIVPHHHHPTTVTLSANRRMKLLQLIREYNFPVIEDDYDYDYHYSRSPILPLASADHGGNVINIGSLTKSLAPSIRLGYLVAPENFAREAALLKRMIDIRGDFLMEEALAMLFSEGHMQRHLKKSVKLYGERRDLLCGLLEEELGDIVSFQKPSGGMAVWLQFNKKQSLISIADRAAEQGLYMSDGSFYNTGAVNYNALRMGFASLNEKEIRETIDILKRATIR